jgi:hypothetical protein
MAEYGVTKGGFNIKPFQAIVEEKAERARAMFGGDVDLRPTSALRKLLDISSYEDHELWKRMEQLYYGNFISTASGDALNLLGEDLGVARRFHNATGEVTFKLAGGKPGRVYHLPIGALVETNPPVRRFSTRAGASLSATANEATVVVEAVERGPEGNVPAGAINKINQNYLRRHLSLGAATVSVKNIAPTTGGDQPEDDASYRQLLLGYPRTLWTLEAVTHAVRSVDGVRDCRAFDPLGGVDVSLSRFKKFLFSQRRFGTQRLLGAPYFFDIMVAIHPGFHWESEGGVVGVKEEIDKILRDVRPISIFPNLRLANNILVGLRAKVLIKPGHDRNAVAASIKERLESRVTALKLGGETLYSAVLCDCMEVSGVVDVQQLHLRRCPPLFARVSFGSRIRFQSDAIEAAVGENLSLLPDEIAVFKVDSELIDLEVSDR